MTGEIAAGLRDEMAILSDEREELRRLVDGAVAEFARTIAFVDDRIVRFTERSDELRARSEMAGEPFTVPTLARLSAFRREPVATLTRFEGREH